MKPSKQNFFAELSKKRPAKHIFSKLTQLEDRLGTLIDLSNEADNLVENIEEATNAWENKVYEAKEYYNGEIFDEIESVRAAMDELGVSIEGTSFESVSRQAEELNDKLSGALGTDLFVITRDLKNRFS